MNKTFYKAIIAISMFLVTALCSLVFVSEAKAATYQSIEADYEYEQISGGVRITKYTGLSLQQVADPVYSVVIPAKIDDQAVKEIASSAFAGQKRIEEFVIPKTVTAIEDHAFVNCNNLKKVQLPSSLTKIGAYAFYNTQLKTVSIPQKVKAIGSYAFGCDGIDVQSQCTAINVSKSNKKYCSVDGVLFNKSRSKLIYYPGAKKNTTFTAPAKLSAMTGWAFNDARKLKSINLKKSKITSLPDNAFQLSQLTSISFPSKLKKIGSHTFEKSGITSIVIPENVLSIGESAFYNCKLLKKVNITSKKLTHLPNGTFSSCYALTEVKLPESLTVIGENAFSSCVELRKMNVPANVTTIGDNAFRMCGELTTVKIKGTVNYIGYHAFEGDPNLTIIAKKGTYPESFAKQRNIQFKKL